MPTDGRPLKRPLIQNFVVSSEVVKKNVQKIRPSFFVVYCATPDKFYRKYSKIQKKKIYMFGNTRVVIRLFLFSLLEQ